MGKFLWPKFSLLLVPQNLDKRAVSIKSLLSSLTEQTLCLIEKSWGNKSEDLGSNSCSTQFLTMFYWINNNVSGLIPKIENEILFCLLVRIFMSIQRDNKSKSALKTFKGLTNII